MVEKFWHQEWMLYKYRLTTSPKQKVNASAIC